MRQIPYSHSTKSSQMPEVGWPVVGGLLAAEIYLSTLGGFFRTSLSLV